MEQAIDRGQGDRDTAVLMKHREEQLGIEVRQAPAAAGARKVPA
jgi:hypothetical protein